MPNNLGKKFQSAVLRRKQDFTNELLLEITNSNALNDTQKVNFIKGFSQAIEDVETGADVTAVGDWFDSLNNPTKNKLKTRVKKVLQKEIDNLGTVRSNSHQKLMERVNLEKSKRSQLLGEF